MPALEPLLEDVSTREYNGRFHVQLEIPKSSTLTEKDIDKIGALSSWDVDPNHGAENYEGSRSVLISREIPIVKKGIVLEALQISGIGYREVKFEFENLVTIDEDSRFNPPTQDNFIARTPGTMMTTSYIENGKLVHSRPKYRALGTYLFSELRTKLEKTNEVSQLDLEQMAVPHVEAHGRFLDDELKNEEGNFGFIVFPVPSVSQQRISEEIVRKFLDSPIIHESPKSSIEVFYTIASTHVGSLSLAARELHDKARMAHLQLHLSNAYLASGLPYIMDWSTMIKLGGNKENDVGYRAIDIKKPVDNFKTIFSKIFSNAPGNFVDVIWASVQELVMELYSGKPQQEINLIDVYSRAKEALGRNASDFESIVQWIKDLGVEGFPYVPESKKRSSGLRIEDTLKMDFSAKLVSPITSQPKVGRNEPCPCESGKKYKKCCGRNN